MASILPLNDPEEKMNTDSTEKDYALLEEHCRNVALQFMKMHPVAGRLPDTQLKETCLKSLHAMTVELEVIKKHLIKARNRDDSTEL